jgi:hypothetical protein
MKEASAKITSSVIVTGMSRIVPVCLLWRYHNYILHAYTTCEEWVERAGSD